MRILASRLFVLCLDASYSSFAHFFIAAYVCVWETTILFYKNGNCHEHHADGND